MKTYTIHLIRHMPSEGNLQGRYIGRTESPLAMESIRNLIELKKEINYPKAEAFFASPSTRCFDSLKVIYPDADPQVIMQMAECDFGDWENKTAEELKDDETFKLWIENGSKAAPPNGESGIVFMQRVCAGFEMLVKNLMHEGKTSAVLVTHGGVIMSILSAYGIPEANFYDWLCEPGHGYSVRITPMLWMREMRMEVYDTIPSLSEKKKESTITDVAREAAERAFGK